MKHCPACPTLSGLSCPVRFTYTGHRTNVLSCPGGLHPGQPDSPRTATWAPFDLDTTRRGTAAANHPRAASQSREALEHAARTLARQGLTERDVGELLGIGTTAAAQLIRPQTQWGSQR
jgi:hypothetical protein